MKIVLSFSVALFLLIFWLLPNSKTIPFLATQVDESLEILEDGRRQYLHEITLLTQAFPQYQHHYYNVIMKDSLCKIAIEENWDLALLDSALLVNLYEGHLNEIRENAEYIDESYFCHDNFFNSLKTVLIQERNLIHHFHHSIFMDVVINESWEKRLSSLYPNPTIELGDSLNMNIIISNLSLRSQNTLQSVWINDKPYPIQEKYGRKYAIYKTTKTEKTHKITVKIKANFRNQQPKIVERTFNLFQ